MKGPFRAGREGLPLEHLKRRLSRPVVHAAGGCISKGAPPLLLPAFSLRRGPRTGQQAYLTPEDDPGGRLVGQFGHIHEFFQQFQQSVSSSPERM